MRPRVQRAPGLPCALYFLGRGYLQTSGAWSRENAEVCLTVIARSTCDEAIQSSFVASGLLRGACHRARIRATRWLAMTVWIGCLKFKFETQEALILRRRASAVSKDGGTRGHGSRRAAPHHEAFTFEKLAKKAPPGGGKPGGAWVARSPLRQPDNLFAHDLQGKPASTFPDHALLARSTHAVARCLTRPPERCGASAARPEWCGR
jgi:hypothetical protein